MSCGRPGDCPCGSLECSGQEGCPCCGASRRDQRRNLIVVDCEAPWGVGAPSVGDMAQFGAVQFQGGVPDPAAKKGVRFGPWNTFHGEGFGKEIFERFELWLAASVAGRPVFVSDNPAYDFQWINYYFWKHLGRNPFGHSGRRIADYYAGLRGDFGDTQRWKRLRITKHDHHPVHDAVGNAEALARIFMGER